MEDQKETTVIINQTIDRELYKRIKIIATIDEKKINEVMSEAFIQYANSRGIK